MDHDQYYMYPILSKKKQFEKTLKLAERDRDTAKSPDKKVEFQKMIEDLKDQISMLSNCLLEMLRKPLKRILIYLKSGKKSKHLRNQRGGQFSSIEANKMKVISFKI